MLVLIATIPFHPPLIPYKSFRSQSFVLSAPEIKVFPTTLTMLTQDSVPFLFDLRLIPV